jgi:tRNA pseudouridine38-40 synthase
VTAFKITLAYDGTGFVGWQRQASGTSIQGLLEDALRELDGRLVTVVGAGRTDAGVHALGQVAAFSIDRAIGADVLMRAVNARLPPAVRIVAAEEAPPGFHPRFSARKKTYRYRIWNGEVISPFERQYAWHITGVLDVERMASAARLVEGRHDFAAFQAAGSETQTTEREVFSSRVVCARSAGLKPRATYSPYDAYDPRSAELQLRERRELIHYEITGDGFLRHMVRTIVGTLVEIGRGRRSVESIAETIRTRDRGAAGATAPPEGLFLVAVSYETLLAAER